MTRKQMLVLFLIGDFIVAAVVLFFIFFSQRKPVAQSKQSSNKQSFQQGAKGENVKNDNEKNGTQLKENLKLTIVYDNNAYKKGLKSAWGFSCLVQKEGKTVLFDVGGDALSY